MKGMQADDWAVCGRINMGIIDSVKNTAFSTAVNTVLDYLEKNPEGNIPKAMGMMDRVLPDGWYEGL